MHGAAELQRAGGLPAAERALGPANDRGRAAARAEAEDVDAVGRGDGDRQSSAAGERTRTIEERGKGFFWMN